MIGAAGKSTSAAEFAMSAHSSAINSAKNSISSVSSMPACLASWLNLAFLAVNINLLMVDLGGFAPPSRTLFSSLHTAITYSIYLFWLCVNL